MHGERAARHTPLWRNVSFTLMWTSTAASGFGDRMIMFAALALLGGLVVGITNSTAIYASTQFFFFLPYVLFSALAGWVADSVPRKWLMLVCDESRALILGAAFLTVLTTASGPANIPDDHHWKVYLTLFLIGTCAAFFNPARNAVVPQIVDITQLPPANALVLGINVVASMIGMIAADRIIRGDAAASVQNGLLIAALFYGVSGWFFAFMKTRGHAAAAEPRTRRGERVHIVAYALAHRRILALIGLQVLLWSSAAVVSSGLLGVAKVCFGLSGEAMKGFFATSSAVLGAGMLLGAIGIGWAAVRRESPLPMFAGVVGAGVCVAVLATSRWWWLSMAAALGVGVFGNVVIVCSTTLLQNLSPNFIRGRVMGLNSLCNTCFSVLTYLAIWRLPHADERIVPVMATLGVGLVVVGAWGLIRYLLTGPLPNRTANVLLHFCRLFLFVWHRLEVIGRANVPARGPVILAPNHTTGLDPFLIQSGCLRLVRWLMLTEYLYAIANPLWRAVRPIALDKDSGDLNKIRQVVEVLREGEIVGMFPEGALQREKRVLAPFKPGVGMIARRGEAVIVPVWIHGTPRVHHMLWHFLWPSRSTVIFGKPFATDRSMTAEQVTATLRERMIELSRHPALPAGAATTDNAVALAGTDPGKPPRKAL